MQRYGTSYQMNIIILLLLFIDYQIIIITIIILAINQTLTCTNPSKKNWVREAIANVIILY